VFPLLARYSLAPRGTLCSLSSSSSTHAGDVSSPSRCRCHSRAHA
jgi:hypothetical protein